MIPRYLPTVDLQARLQAPREAQGAPERLVRELAPGHAFAGRRAAPTLREALNACFQDLAQRAGHGEVAMSAQICPLVPLAARNAGFAPRFVDIAEDRPSPSGRQFTAVMDRSVKALVIAPLYGHIGEGLDAMLGGLGERCALVLDLAQGIGLRGLEPLFARADAVGYSFTLGKGLDTGGGLLLTRKPLDVSCARNASLGVGSLARSALLRTIAALGLYGAVSGAVDRAAQARPQDFDSRARVLRGDWVYGWWRLRLTKFLAEVELARRRAESLHSRLGAHPALVHAAACFSSEATHLRQIIRLADPGRREAVQQRLRRSGIDCAPAGEPLPAQYVPGERGDYPAARRFLADALRLPFLGRLSERQFNYLADALERALD